MLGQGWEERGDTQWVTLGNPWHSMGNLGVVTISQPNLPLRDAMRIKQEEETHVCYPELLEKDEIFKKVINK